MISVDQIYLLQKKVESAVLKIEQLKSENDALRTKCSELTNALSEKTELLSSFMADEKKIESGIMSALERLDSVENALLDNAAQNSSQSDAPSEGDTQTQEQISAPAENGEQTVVAENEALPASDETPVSQETASQGVQNATNQEGGLSENDGFEFGAGAEEKDSLFGDTSFETEDENPPQEIF